MHGQFHLINSVLQEDANAFLYIEAVSFLAEIRLLKQSRNILTNMCGRQVTIPRLCLDTWPHQRAHEADCLVRKV